MTLRANVCVAVLVMILASGCATRTTAPVSVRTCDRVETVWDEETQATKIVESGCTSEVRKVESRYEALGIVLKVIGTLLSLLAFLL